MERIIYYTVVTSDSLEQLMKSVNFGIDNGDQPFGSLAVETTPEGVQFHQPMITKRWEPQVSAE